MTSDFLSMESSSRCEVLPLGHRLWLSNCGIPACMCRGLLDVELGLPGMTWVWNTSLQARNLAFREGSQNLIKCHLVYKLENSGLRLSDFPKFWQLVFIGSAPRTRVSRFPPRAPRTRPWFCWFCSVCGGVERKRELDKSQNMQRQLTALPRLPLCPWTDCSTILNFPTLHFMQRWSLRLVPALAFCSLPLFCASAYQGPLPLVFKLCEAQLVGGKLGHPSKENLKISFDPTLTLLPPVVSSIISAVTQGRYFFTWLKFPIQPRKSNIILTDLDFGS